MSIHLPSITQIDDLEHWDETVAACRGHLFQSSAWGEFKSRFGWEVERCAWLEKNFTYAVAQVLYRRLAPGFRLAYIPRGPVLATREPATIAPFLSALARRAQQRGAFLLKVEPNWRRGDIGDDALRRASFCPSLETVQPPRTIQIDLTRDAGAILAAMKPKWRYNIRLAERKGVMVRQGVASDLHTFYRLMEITGRRDGFAIHGAAYYRAAFELLTVQDRARLFVAEYANRPLAMIFVSAFGDQAIYLYGASGNQERQRMPNHALHWAAIRWAKARGCRTYDLWGIPAEPTDAAPATNLPPGLYQFKQGFGGEIVLYSGAWDLVFDRARYAVYCLARRLRRSGLGSEKRRSVGASVLSSHE